MTATKDSTAKKRKTKERKREADRGADTDSNGAPPPAESWSAESAPVGRTTRREPPPPAVKGRAASERIRELAERCELLQTRRQLRSLARLVAARPKNVRGLSFVETAIGECLEESDQALAVRDQWLLREAAVWGLAWLARSRRAGGSAGGLLEQAVRRASGAATALADRDTAPAAFVLTLARLFCDIEACRLTEAGATSALEEEIGRLVSDEGSLGLSGSAAVINRICRWARCRQLGLDTGGLPWDRATEQRFTTCLATGLRLLGGRGRMLVGVGRLPLPLTKPLLDAATRCTERRRVQRTAQALATGTTRTAAAKGLLACDQDDQEAAMAILRSGWAADSLRVLVEYRNAMPRLELAIGDRLLLDGEWRWEVTCDGESLPAEGPWETNCLETKQGAVFFEIKAPLAGGLQFERSVTLLTIDRVVLLADAITRRDGRPPAGDLRFSASLPVANGLEIEPADETREIYLYDTAMRCLALPLGLPEWRTGGRGEFALTPEGLTVEQQGRGRLFAPVWLDCDSRRLGEQVTWRQLTVADTRINLPPSMAAGHRVQVGLDQWLLYRSLDASRNRTLLGCNVACEFLLGRITPDGTVQRAIEIE
jgi:hypothetical protein